MPLQARDLRLVRVGATELAMQFEFANNSDRAITPDTLGIDQYERVLMLADLPRSTSYETLTAQGNDGRDGPDTDPELNLTAAAASGGSAPR